MPDEQAVTPAQAVPDAARSVTKFTAEDAHEVRLPSPSAVNYMVSVANLLLDSTLITPDMGKTVEQVKSNAIAKMLVGLDFEMSPMESLQEIDIVRNRVFMRYPRLMAALDKKGLKPRWVERTNEKCSLAVTRPGREEEVYEYTIEDAKMAGLVSSGSQYVLRPRVMLSARAISEAYRMTGGKSNVYTPEEKQEITENDLRENGQPAANGAESENRFTVGRKPAPDAGSNAEFAAAGKAAAVETKPVVVETAAVKEEAAKPEPETKPVQTEAVATESRTKVCGCSAGSCMILEDGKIPHGRFCREGRTLGMPAQTAEPAAEPVTEPANVAEDPDAAYRKKVFDALQALTDLYPKAAPKTVMAQYNKFFRSVLGVTGKLPGDPAVYEGLIPAVRATVVSDPDAFWKDPAGAGRVEAEDRKFIAEKLGEWKWNTGLMPLVLKVKYFFGILGVDVCEYIEKTQELTKVAPAAAEAFLRMATVSREVYRVIPLAKWSTLSYDELLKHMEEKMEKPVEQFTEKQFIGLVEIGEKSMAEATAAASAPKPELAKAASPTAGQTDKAPNAEPLLWDTEA